MEIGTRSPFVGSLSPVHRPRFRRIVPQLTIIRRQMNWFPIIDDASSIYQSEPIWLCRSLLVDCQRPCRHLMEVTHWKSFNESHRRVNFWSNILNCFAADILLQHWKAVLFQFFQFAVIGVWVSEQIACKWKRLIQKQWRVFTEDPWQGNLPPWHFVVL